jgi:uncharacterized protein
MRLRSASLAGCWILLFCLCGTISAAEPVCGYPEKATAIITTAGKSGVPFHVGIADTTPLHRKGLMECPLLPKGRGLLFIFDDLQERSFWMRNTRMALAIIYIGDDLRVVSVQRGEPGSTATLPSGRPVRYVLEVNWDEGKGVNSGDTVKLSFD